MKRCLVLFAVAGSFAAFPATNLSAQATAAATRVGEIRVGVAYSNGNSDEEPKRIGGFTVYGSYNILPHFALVGEANLLRFSTPQDYGQDTYLGGGRVFLRKRRYEPYLKFLGGIGESVAQENYVTVPGAPDSFGMFAGGGGLDIHVANKFVIRAVDFEKQVWPAFSPRDLSPSVLSFGIAYRIR